MSRDRRPAKRRWGQPQKHPVVPIARETGLGDLNEVAS